MAQKSEVFRLLRLSTSSFTPKLHGKRWIAEDRARQRRNFKRGGWKQWGKRQCSQYELGVLDDFFGSAPPEEALIEGVQTHTETTRRYDWRILEDYF